MTGPWALALGAALFVGIAIGVAGSWLWTRALNRRMEAAEEQYQDLPDEPEEVREEWPLRRITPERYLERFSTGPHAELAERIVRH